MVMLSSGPKKHSPLFSNNFCWPKYIFNKSQNVISQDSNEIQSESGVRNYFTYGSEGAIMKLLWTREPH
jgi:hypothetical protein